MEIKKYRNAVEFDSKVNVFGKYNKEVINFSKSAIRISANCLKKGMSTDEVAYELAKEIPNVEIYTNAKAKNGKFIVKED